MQFFVHEHDTNPNIFHHLLESDLFFLVGVIQIEIHPGDLRQITQQLGDLVGQRRRPAHGQGIQSAQIGQFDVVTISLGEAEGMEIGHVMKIWRAGETIRDSVSGRRFDRVTLPDEEAGLLMVFRTFERVSYALVMKASRAIHVHDFVRTP